MNFLITCNADGTIATCEAVEGKKLGMFYVKASTKEEACAIFAARYRKERERGKERHRSKERERKKAGLCTCGETPRRGKRTCIKCHERVTATRLEKIAKGQCPCGRPLSPGKKMCEAHLEHKRQREHAIRHGLPIPPRPGSVVRAAKGENEQAALYIKRVKDARLAQKLRGDHGTAHAKAKLFRKVLSQYRSLSPERFEGWLVSELNKEQDAKRERSAQERARHEAAE